MTLGDVSQLDQGGLCWSPLATSCLVPCGNPQAPILWSFPIIGTDLWQEGGWAGQRREGKGERALQRRSRCGSGVRGMTLVHPDGLSL